MSSEPRIPNPQQPCVKHDPEFEPYCDCSQCHPGHVIIITEKES